MQNQEKYLEREQNSKINTKILAGKVRIPNLKAFLATLKSVASNYDGVVVQALNADLVAGEEHLKSAVQKAVRAEKSGRNLTSDLGLEVLLYAAGRRQIGRALEIGVSASEREGDEKSVAVVIFDAVREGEGKREKELDLEAVAAEVKRKTGLEEEAVLELNEAKRERIKKFFGVTEAELRAVGEGKGEGKGEGEGKSEGEGKGEGKGKGEEKLGKLVLERVALLEVLK